MIRSESAERFRLQDASHRGRPPTRGRRGRRDSLTRITRSRTNVGDQRGLPDAAERPASGSVLGQPPAQCSIVTDFGDDPTLQAVVSATRATWVRNVESRLCANEKVMGDMHAMLVEMRPVPAVSSAPAALGSAAQAVDDAVAGHSASQLPADIPWPTVDSCIPGIPEGMGSLPETAQSLMMAGSSYSLPLDAQIPDALRTKIWAGDFVDLSLLLKG